MKRKLVLGLVVAIFVFSIIAVQPVVADLHQHYDLTISPLGHRTLSASLAVGSGEYGSFTLTSGTNIDFYIADEYNYNRAVAGQSYTRYCAKEDVTQGSYKFRIPYADTWYFVFCNADNFITTQKVSVDVYVDFTAPTFSTNLKAGAIYSGVRTITVSASDATFAVKSIKLYINNALKKTEYDGSLSYNWYTKDYSNGPYTIKIVVSDTVNNVDSSYYGVDVDNYIAPTTTTSSSSPTGLGSLIQLSIMFGIPLICIGGIVYAAKRRGGKEDEPLVELDEGKLPSKHVLFKSVKDEVEFGILGKVQESGSAVREKIVTERVLVICPYCGAKTEQGIMKCQNCGADL